MNTKNTREKNIKLIIDMEERISKCKRCTSLVRCRRKPSLGKGDLEPEVMLVFEAENGFNCELDNIIELRNYIKKELEIQRIYHSYLVRCQPKACTRAKDTNLYGKSVLLDKDYNCMLNGRRCDGIPVHPLDEEIMSCLPFIIEEIEILKPKHIILFGTRVTEFLLRSYGIFDEIEIGNNYFYKEQIIYSVIKEEHFINSNFNKVII